MPKRAHPGSTGANSYPIKKQRFNLQSKGTGEKSSWATETNATKSTDTISETRSKTKRKHKKISEDDDKAPSVNALKSRIRSLRRLLEHDDQVFNSSSQDNHNDPSDPFFDNETGAGGDKEPGPEKEGRQSKRKALPATIRIAHERELQSLEHDVAEAEARARRKKMIGKWHMVRFFERRKAERRLRQIRKDNAAHRESEGMEHDALVDLNYTLYFPLDRAYVSLWPKGKNNDHDEEEKSKGDMEMWKMVEQCMDNGRLKDLREGRLTRSAPTNGNGPVKSAVKKDKRHKTTNTTADGDESDGGFFE